MNQWEIWTWDEHPAVIISHPDRAARKETVEVVACSTSRAGRTPRENEVLLDTADGLDWETLLGNSLLLRFDLQRAPDGFDAPTRQRDTRTPPGLGARHHPEPRLGRPLK